MGNINADVIRVELTTEASAAGTLKPKMMAYAKDTRRSVWMEGDNTLRYAWDSTRLADQSGTYGVAVIGSAGITGITPNGGSSGSAATLANMLTGIRDCVILKSPYNSTINTIQPTADYVPLTIKGFAAGVSKLLSLQTSATEVAWFDNAANLTLSRSDAGSNVAVSVLNSNNSNTASNALILLSTGGSGSGDPYIRHNVSGVQDWAAGVDTSDGRKYKIAASSTLGAGNDWISITPAGAITLNGATSIPNNLDVSGIISTANGIKLPSGVPIYSIVSAAALTLIESVSTAIYIGDTSGWTNIIHRLPTGGQHIFQINGSNTALIDGAALHIQNAAYLQMEKTGNNQIVLNSSSGQGYISNTGANAWALGYGSNPVALGTSALTWNNSGAVGIPGTLGVTGTLTAAVINATGDVTISRSTAGLQNLFSVVNSDNTDANSRARAFIGVGGSSAGDASIAFNVASATTWAFGIDNSVSGDPIKISFGGTLGTNDALTIDSNLLASFGGSVSLDGGAGTYFRFPRGTSDPTSPAAGWCYYNTAGNHLFLYNGATWLQIV